MKAILFTNWHFMRWLRLVLALIMIVQAFIVKDIVLGIIGLLFVLSALFNIGCCGAGGCYTPTPNNKKTNNTIEYEEVA
jgi:hypothetical protein